MYLEANDFVPHALVLPVVVAALHDGVRGEEDEQPTGHDTRVVEQQVPKRVQVLRLAPGDVMSYNASLPTVIRRFRVYTLDKYRHKLTQPFRIRYGHNFED